MDKLDGNIRESYKLYRKISKNPIRAEVVAPEGMTGRFRRDFQDRKDYVDLSNEYNKFLMSKVLEGEEISLPHGLGYMSIIGRKQEIRYNERGELTLPPDWVATKKLRDEDEVARDNKTIVYQLNSHTNGVRYKIHWSKRVIRLENISLYTLKMTRMNKRTVNKLIKQGKEYLIKQ